LGRADRATRRLGGDPSACAPLVGLELFAEVLAAGGVAWLPVSAVDALPAAALFSEAVDSPLEDADSFGDSGSDVPVVGADGTSGDAPTGVVGTLTLTSTGLVDVSPLCEDDDVWTFTTPGTSIVGTFTSKGSGGVST
jgi:hypothetical protein